VRLRFLTDDRLERIESKLDALLKIWQEFEPMVRTMMNSGPWKWAMRKGKTNV
jgi:hypothetical protein